MRVSPFATVLLVLALLLASPGVVTSQEPIVPSPVPPVPGPVPPPNRADAYEPDDVRAQARAIRSGEFQRHNAHYSGDQDWVFVDVPGQGTLALWTCVFGAGSDTLLALYTPDGQLLERNDDASGRPTPTKASQVQQQVAAGRYYARVTQVGDLSGPGTEYLLAANVWTATNYQIAHVSQTLPRVAGPGERQTVTLRLKNVGSQTWTRDSVFLTTDRPRSHVSELYTAGSWVSATTPTRLDQDSVLPNEEATFTFELTAPARPGLYREYYRPELRRPVPAPAAGGGPDAPRGEVCPQRLGEPANSPQDFNDIGIYFELRVVDPGAAFRAAWVDQSFPLVMAPGERRLAWIALRNVGAMTWERSGARPVLLGTDHPRERTSAFFDPTSWVGPTRPARLDQEQVGPGDVGSFSFELVAPTTPGLYKEYFTAVAEGMTWLNDLGVYFEIRVQ
ncbi:MAG: hypothetical protein HY329_21560 [Chloroflexi bacterium]|nr:hypothetical protein [Chloroflexota bacterium]